MAANIFRVNLCAIRSDTGGAGLQTTGIPTSNPTAPSGISSEIRILDSNLACSKTAPVTTFPDPKDTSYTFFGRTDTVGGPFTYSWDFVRAKDGVRITATGACLENFDLKNDGTWTVTLTVTDTVTQAVSKTVSMVDIIGTTPRPSNLSLSIRASSLDNTAPADVQFASTLTGGIGPYAYLWTFDDGTTSTEVNPKHSFITSGIRNVRLTVKDANGVTAEATTVLTFRNPDSGSTATGSVTALPSGTASGSAI